MDCQCLNAVEGEREVECPKCFGNCDDWVKEGEIVVNGEVGEVGHADYCPTCLGIGRVIMTYKKCPDCKKEVMIKVRPLK
jgi:DnaJ-class molecular chaperone